MAAKRKAVATPSRTAALQPNKQRLASGHLAQLQSGQCIEDYIWSAMQCYAADIRSGRRPNQRYV